MTGIYKIQSKCKLERVYIGSAINIKNRWNRHLHLLKSSTHCNIKLQNHYNKYGETDLQFTVLIECDKESLITNEQIFIDRYNPYFNICKIAGTSAGIKHTEKARKKMSEAKLYTYLGKDNPFFGKHHSDESKKKNRDAHIGRTGPNLGKQMKKESIEKMRMSLKGRVSNMKGKTHSDEAKSKIREARKLQIFTKGWHHTDESKEKMRLSHTGLKQSEATVDKRVNKCIGRKRSEETKKLMSEVAIKREALKKLLVKT